MSALFSAVARRASPTVSKFGLYPLCLDRIVAAANTTTTATPRFFSSSEAVRADERMKRVLEARIRRREEFVVPKDFPFEIAYDSDDRLITLKRNVFGENIKVEAYMRDWCDEEDEGELEDEDSKDDADEDFDSWYFDFTVNIDKGKDKCLEFICTSTSKGITVEKISLQPNQDLEEEDGEEKEEDDDDDIDDEEDEDSSEKPASRSTPKYSGRLDETLREAALKYLEVRGVHRSLLKFMTMYEMDENTEQLDWLKNVKDFITM